MRNEASLVLDEKDEELAALLADLGLPRNLAKAMVFLTQVDEAISTDIEHGAGLRQPEVSVAMRDLRSRNWVEKSDLKKEGKGRPVHCYRVLIKLGDIIALLEDEKRREAEKNAELLKRLRELAG